MDFLRRSTVVAFFLATIPACNNAAFEGKENKKPLDRRESDDASQSIQVSNDDGTRFIQDDENEVSDRPQEVSGAFLACAELYGPVVSASQLAYGCRVMQGDAMLPLSSNKVTWSVRHDKMIDLSTGMADVRTLEPDAPWHIQLKIESRLAEGLVVIADLEGGAGAKDSPQRLELKLAEARTGQDARLGEATNFRLGNDELDQSSCISKLLAFPTARHRLAMPVVVKEQATVLTLSLTEICGVDPGYSNWLTVKHAGKIVKRAHIRPGKTSMTLADVLLPLGDVSVEIESYAEPGRDRDDFIVGGIFLEASKPVSFGELTAAE